MSLYGMMRTGASGMNAQANRLGTVADNMANANTTGYKRASAEFSSLILPGSAGSYNSGAVTTDVRYSISQAGALEFTSSKTDMALDGSGFFIVTDDNGLPFSPVQDPLFPMGKGIW
jgi:flagellar hook protein FlgE